MRTVFIIGAGANVEIGMPSGDELKKEIANLLDFYWQGKKMTKGDVLIYSAIDKYFPDDYKLKEACVAAISISNAMPFSISIDSFIESRRGEQENRK